MTVVVPSRFSPLGALASRNLAMGQHGIEEMQIREGSREDVQVLRELWATCGMTTYGPLIGVAGVNAMLRELDEGECRDMLPGSDERVLLAGRDDQVIGSAIFANRRGTAYLWGMYVHPDHQRQGVGAALLANVAARLPPTTTIEAHVLASSSGAQAFYSHFGFVEVGSCTSPLGVDDPGRPAVVMSVTAAALNPR